VVTMSKNLCFTF